MPLTDHLEELRRRLFIILIGLFVGGAVSFYFVFDVMEFLLEIPGELTYLSVAEAFFAHIRLAIISAIIISLPVTLYQIIAFLLPGLSSRERKYLILGLPAALVLFATGVYFAYSIILPLAFDFFMSFGGDDIQPHITVSNYISFVKGLVIPFGVVFQLPLMVMVLTGVGIITPQFLRTNRKIVIFIIFIMAAFLTPPDIISQVLMAGPLLLLYEISILISALIYRRKSRAEEDPLWEDEENEENEENEEDEEVVEVVEDEENEEGEEE